MVFALEVAFFDLNDQGPDSGVIDVGEHAFDCTEVIAIFEVSKLLCCETEEFVYLKTPALALESIDILFLLNYGVDTFRTRLTALRHTCGCIVASFSFDLENSDKIWRINSTFYDSRK